MKKLLLMLALPVALLAADDLEKLRDKQDRPGLEKAAAALQTQADRTPDNSEVWYKAATAQSYAAEVAMELKDKPGSQRLAEAGIKDIEKAISLDGKKADYYRLLGTLCGQVIPANPLMGVLTYGKKAKESLDKAIALDPKSSKAFLARGVGNYYLPANFGGGPDVAIKDLQEALRLDPKNADAHLWMGMTLKKKQQNAQAREEFQKALQLSPDRIWTKQQLEKTPAQ